uniref:NADH-ubiquinone oxidoreductase chain 4 n=1 Tax=Paramacrosteles nigromaculatus TaxID=2665880 RepID=A0A5Q2N0U1_9HEMI|nr:NADH dehydrogenase subunit 4 [Paramacrosteles nigromaculatus]QGG46175.1 NADH dehydrogenase subunit 4 [Paramacrosteles nigromaculatus]
MKLLIMMIMMIPLSFSSFFFIQFFYLFMYMYMLFSFYCFNYFSNISLFLGFDSFSYLLIMLTFLIGSYMMISMHGIHSSTFYSFINLFLVICLFLIFSSMNFLYMYISFEVVLVPLLILILGWGYQPERLLSGMYLFFYTVLVSLPLFMLIIFFYMNYGSIFFDNMNYYSEFYLVHFILVFVFLVKMPMFLVHFWLPKAHVQAPVSGSMILAGLMLKIGGYGLIRIMFMYEYMFMKYSYIWFSLSMLGSVLVSLVCLIQGDMKCLIAYSSVAHMGMSIMGLMTMNSWGLLGSYLLMLGHGFCSSGMFYMANLFYIRTSSRSFYINKGLMMYMPSCSMIWFLFCSFNMSCPPSINFISEFMILSSMMSFWFKSIFFFFFVSLLCACFSYYLYSFSQHGLYHNLYSFSSINLMEFLCLSMHMVPLVFCPLVISCFIY